MPERILLVDDQPGKLMSYEIILRDLSDFRVETRDNLRQMDHRLAALEKS